MIERIKILLNLFCLINDRDSYYFSLSKSTKEKTIVLCRETDPQGDMGDPLEIDTKIKNKKDFLLQIFPEEYGPKTLEFHYLDRWNY